MEKETVLEIEFQPVFDKWAWRIKKNKIIGGKIEDNEIKTSIYIDRNNFANIDLDKEDNYLITTNLLVNKAMKDRLEYIVEKVNKKYGVPKRWRAEDGNYYYHVDDEFIIQKEVEDYMILDNNRYNIGNYFRTKEEAEEYAEYIKKCSLEWHEKKGGGE